ncbi:TetR/AcrR family transcriptional regulator [Dactylosporangium sp. NPDC050588]|uniref:TetR/AcrR family transcriptional regulator n=1 Tax=Dactylosporangium sp. NPDC050588 TaxID=3157211 RepID=UPI0033EC0D0B
MKSNRRTQEQRSEATRAALIQAARPLFAASGFTAVGTEAIVRAAGVTRGAMYHQFADKTDLFAAVFEAVEADLTRRIDDAVGGSGLTDPIALMRLGAATWLDACAEPEVQRIVLIEAPSVLGWARWREISLRHGMGLVQSLVSYAISVGRIAEQPPEPLSHVLIGAIDEAALYLSQAEDPVRARADIGAVLDRLIDSLAV